MVRNIADSLRRIKEDLRELLQPAAIEQACREVGHVWRERTLGPVTTIYLFLLQVLHGNSACSHTVHWADQVFSASAYCQARMRLPRALLERLLRWVVRALGATTEEEGRWLGHRVFAVDGSSFSMPDTPELQEHFGQPGAQKPGCGFPVAHLLALFHAGTGLLIQVLASPLRTHDMARVWRMHPELGAGDLLLADRGFCSFAHLALLFQQKLHAVFRLHQRMLVDFTPHRRYAPPGKRQGQRGLPASRWLRQLGVTDQLVEWFKPRQRPRWMTPEQWACLPESIVVRELRYAVRVPGFRAQQVTLVTTLLDGAIYPAEELARLYGRRWQVELDLRHLKQTMGMDVLHCQTVEGVQKELLVYCLVYNLVRVVLLEAARRQGVAPERLSFIDALRWLLEARSVAHLARLMVNPSRPGRVEPRVRKRRPKQYPLMQEPRHAARNLLEEQNLAA